MLNHEEIKKYLQAITNLQSKKDDLNKFKKNNITICLTVLYAKKYPDYVSKHNSNREKHVILLMIVYGEGPKGKDGIILQLKTISNIKRNYIW